VTSAILSGAEQTDCGAHHLSTCDFYISSYNFTRAFDKEEQSMPTTLERLQRLFLANFDYKIEELTAATTLEYLGLDSLDMIKFMFEIENEFNIRIADREFKITTIQDMVDALDRLVSEQHSERNIGSSSHLEIVPT
jgi:acyl carrier protein